MGVSQTHALTVEELGVQNSAIFTDDLGVLPHFFKHG
jgi:hypothetical protein